MKLRNYSHVVLVEVNLLIGLCIFMLSCTQVQPQQEDIILDELENLNNIDRIEVFYDNYPNSRSIKVIDEPEKINLIVDTFRSYANDWRRYYPTPPKAPLAVSFYNGDSVQAAIGIGYRQTDTETFFYLARLFDFGKPLQEDEFTQLLNVLDVDKGLAKW